MKGFLFVVLTLIAFVGCGVETDSSSLPTSSSDSNTTNPDSNTTNPDSNTTNPDSNTTNPDSNTTNPDSNTTDPDSNTTDPGGNVDEPDLPSVFDPNACGATGYTSMSDNSFNVSSSEDVVYGFKLTSYYPKSFDLGASEVTLYHPVNLESSLLDTIVFIYTSNYSFSFDQAWIENSNNNIYIQSPPDTDGSFKCYRYELNSDTVSDIKMVLVHKN